MRKHLSFRRTEKQYEQKILECMSKDAKKKKHITLSNQNRLKKIFGTRFVKAKQAIEKERVKKYIFHPSNRVVWIVVGRKRDYLVIPEANFCSCDDFYYSVMQGKVFLCYHLIAQKFAESLTQYYKIDEEDEFFDFLMKEWKKAIL